MQASVFAEATWCNPLALPDLPAGPCSAIVNPACPIRATLGAFREVADPAVIRHEGAWYLYTSSGERFWKSVDNGASWQSLRYRPEGMKVGYAPTVVKHRGRFLLCTGCNAADENGMLFPNDDADCQLGRLYSAPSPEGPFELLGRIRPPVKGEAPDPMLFSDDDGRLYFYWGCSPTGGIWGCELDPSDPVKPISPAKRLIAYDPVSQPWEKFPDKDYGYVEGAWMFKRDGGYYLVFSAGGTEYPTYATGVARGTSPLGPFTLQQNNPVFFTPRGLITGTGHGSVAEDERGEWWYFYSVHMGIRHQFERRIGMDRVTFLPNGDMAAGSASSEPQPLAGVDGMAFRRIEGIALCGTAAFDGSMETEFVPNRPPPYDLDYAFTKAEEVRSTRVIWSDGGYDPAHGVAAGPIRYRIFLQREDRSWALAVDASENERDLAVDYREFAPCRAVAARLRVLGAPRGISPRIVEWTLFREGR